MCRRGLWGVICWRSLGGIASGSNLLEVIRRDCSRDDFKTGGKAVGYVYGIFASPGFCVLG